jgi:hypothetical protein
MWYAGATAESPSLGSIAPVTGSIGVAMSEDGVSWTRGFGNISGAREQEKRDVPAHITLYPFRFPFVYPAVIYVRHSQGGDL